MGKKPGAGGSRAESVAVDRAQVEHIAQIAAENALWHRARYSETGDRYHRGQWKAYARGAWCLRRVEYQGGAGEIRTTMGTNRVSLSEYLIESGIVRSVCIGIVLGVVFAIAKALLF